MGQMTKLKAAGEIRPRAHGLFLVASNGVAVRRDRTVPMNKPNGLRLVRAGETRPVDGERTRLQRGLVERISRAIRAFKAS